MHDLLIDGALDVVAPVLAVVAEPASRVRDEDLGAHPLEDCAFEVIGADE